MRREFFIVILNPKIYSSNTKLTIPKYLIGALLNFTSLRHNIMFELPQDITKDQNFYSITETMTLVWTSGLWDWFLQVLYF